MHKLVLDLKEIDLRFKDRTSEAVFKSSLEPEVLRFGVAASVVGLLLILVSLIPVYIEEASNDENPFLFHAADVRSVIIFWWVSCFGTTGLFFVLGSLRIWLGWFRTWNWEILFMLMVTYYAVSLSFANFWHLPLLFGEHPTEVWAHDARGAEVYILLALHGTLTVVAMYIPVRSCTLWILPLCSVGCYLAMLVFVDSVFPADRFKSVSALMALTVFACQGAYRSEKHRREKWIALQQVLEATEVVKQQEDQIQETAALVKGLRTVANALCDIIVKLTEDLRVCGSEAMLDCFFEKKMEGRLFTEVLAEGDRVRFAALVQAISCQNGGEVHSCMPVTLRKSSSMSEAHLLLVDTGRSMPRYFVGIRVEMEHLDGVHMASVDAGQPPVPGPPVPNFAPLVPTAPANLPHTMQRERDTDQESDFSFTTYPKHAVDPAPAYTSVRARAISLKKVMPRWNVPRDASSCCQFHTVVDSIHEVADFLGEKPCEPLWSTLNGGQCVRCKSMCTQTRTKCVVCGYAPK
mmetsp:Transcript_112956/g.319608  ORF Transcript_112956/g.319608 Transcript_112956/m.319608 type:complete len:520 (-) Transcript_112956:56-1615(-)